MRNKNDKLDSTSVYKTALITCTIALFICFGLKIFGVRLFNLDTSSSILNRLDAVIMGSFILTTLYSMVFCFINSFFVMAIIFCENTKETVKMTIKYFPVVILLMVIKYYVDPSIRIVFDIAYLILVPIIENIKRKKPNIVYRAVINLLLNTIYQVISLFVKNLVLQQGCYGFTISTLYMIDYYIMLTMTYIVFRRCDLWISQVSYFYQQNQLWKKLMTNLNQFSSNRKDR